MRTFENRAFPMMGSTTNGYWPGLGTRFGWSSRLKVMASSDQLRKDGYALSAAMTSLMKLSLDISALY
jgi:hypothetical protein